MSILPKQSYRFNVITVGILTFLAETNRKIYSGIFNGISRDPQVGKMLKNNNKIGELPLPKSCHNHNYHKDR
jgi:hypothetical protein